MAKLLSPEQVEKELQKLEFNWKRHKDSLVIEVEAKDFAEAVWIINEVAQVAEELNHHPDFNLHDYKHLTITTSTHSEGGITHKDLALAEKIDAIITRLDPER